MISVDVKMDGFEALDEKIKEIKRIASGKAGISGVTLDNVPRSGSNAGNSEILEWLRDDHGFDFITMTQQEMDAISGAFAEAAELRLADQRIQANGVLAAAYRAAMLKYGEIMVEKIRDNPYNGQLAESTEAYKQREYGAAYPVGVATGQLLANLAGRSIRFVK